MSTDTPWSTPAVPEDPDPGPRSLAELIKALLDDIRACVVTAVLGVALAFAVGAAWRWVSPPVLGVYSQHRAYYAAPESKTFIARDGWFALFACVAALLVGTFAFLRYRKRGSTGAAVGLAFGGFGASYLASWFGAYVGPGRGSASRVVARLADGSVFDLPLTVRATGVIWLWPAVAVGLYFLLMLLFGPSDPPRPGELAGWGTEQLIPGEPPPPVPPPPGAARPDPMPSDPPRSDPPHPDPVRPEAVRRDAGPAEYGPSGPESSSAQA
jgi:hypothetical protein